MVCTPFTISRKTKFKKGEHTSGFPIVGHANNEEGDIYTAVRMGVRNINIVRLIRKKDGIKWLATE